MEFSHELHMFGIVLVVHCGFRRASVKTASMSKQRKLPTYWCVLAGNKPETGSSHECSLCGYCKAWSTCEAVTQTSCGCTLGSCVSVCTPLTTAPEVFSRQSCDPISLIRAETVHIPLFVKLPAVCFHYFCYTFYLYLNVLGNLRTNVKVKTQ